jgi:hypothetical protein
MNYAGMVMVLLMAGLTMAQMKPVAAPAASAADTIQQNKACFGHENAHMGKAWGFGFRQNAMGENCREQMGAFQGMICCPPPFMTHYSRFHGLIRMKVIAGFLFLCGLFFAAINVLLTVLVSIDMKRRGVFNGLWIPLLLIAGIPTSAIYALFRMGDNILLIAKKE